ncbi:MAG: hypothetical protein IJY16_06335 [Clostridia bacterium]|nr:hypothetical protein [Clostridia bacterium]
MQQDFKRALILRICRGSLLYFLFLLLSLCSGVFFVPDGGAELEVELATLPYIIGTVFIPFALDIAVRIFAENDALIRSDENFRGGKCLPFRENARYILTRREFYMEVATLCLWCLLLPLESVFYPALKWLFAGVTWPRALKKLVILAVMCPLFFGIEFIGWFFSLVAWQQKHFREPPRMWSLRIFLQSAFALAMTIPAFFVLSYLTAIPLTIFYGFMGREWLYYTIPAVFAVVLLLLWFMRAFHARLRYLRILKRRCKEAGFKVSRIRRPLRSLLRPAREINISIEGNGKRYDCKLIGSMQRDCPLYVSEAGVYYCLHAIRVRQTRVFQYISSYRFDFESDGIKILIINPDVEALYAGTPDFYRLIYTGETVGPYKIFEGIPFLNALERDCVERDPNRPGQTPH